MFFFEKKNQKIFTRWHARQQIRRTRQRVKSFCFFFFRKRRVLLRA
jgi:hypothetical protein